MGRRRGSGRKMIEGAQMLDPSVKVQPESINPSLEGNTLIPGITTELINVSMVGKKILKNAKATHRRSQRIQNASSSSRDQDVEPVIVNIEEGENEKDYLEKKIDHLIILLEKGKTGEALLSQEAERCFPTKNPSLTNKRLGMKEDKYKDMYLDSQKKIEELRNENYDLTKKLETALCKLEGYEKWQLVISEGIEKFKDAFFISSLTKTADMVSGLALPRAVKRRRLAKAESRTPAVGRKKVAKR